MMALMCTFAGSLLLMGYSISTVIPHNKKIWSVSFVFTTSGYSGLSIILCYLLIDLYKNKIIQTLAKPFMWHGYNPLFIYVCMMCLDGIISDNLKYTK